MREYLAAPDDDAEAIRKHEATRKQISITDPSSCWTNCVGGPAAYAKDKDIVPHISVFDKSEGKDGLSGRADFVWNPEQEHCTCRGGESLVRNRRKFAKKRSGITEANTIIYRASKFDCDACSLKPQCRPSTPVRKLQRSIHEEAREVARSLVETEAYFKRPPTHAS